MKNLSTKAGLIPGIVLLLLLAGCGLDVEDAKPLSKPEWVEKSLPEEWPETGIDADESGGIHLEWYGAPGDDIDFYTLSRASYQRLSGNYGDFRELARVSHMDGANQIHTYLDNNIMLGSYYAYTLVVHDKSGNSTPAEDTLKFSVMDIGGSFEQRPADMDVVDGYGGQFSWAINRQLEVQDYIITLIDSNDSLIHRERFQPTSYTEPRDFWLLGSDVVLQNGDIYRWRIDFQADYQAGIETQAAESEWAYFVFSL